MLNQAMAHRDFGSVEERFAGIAGGVLEFSLLLAGQEEARTTALARAQEHAAIEAQDVLSQADEALVLG
jgi:hypothetical protein